MYLGSITNLRAIAIVLIVGAHCYGIADYAPTDFLSRLLFNLTSGGTIVFVFISGFLFHHVFFLKNRINIFFKLRASRLLIPYLILSVAPILYRIYFEPDFWSDYISPEKSGALYDYIFPYLLFLVSGDHLVAYWYIPFAITLFLCYPFHTAFIRMKRGPQLLLIAITVLIALVVQRPLPKSLLFIQSLVYLMPVYLIGIYCSVHKERIYDYFRNKEAILLIAFVGVILVQSYLGVIGNTHKAFFTYEGIDTILPQKVLLCLFLMVWLHRFEDYSNKWINLLANTSFAIYFLHGYVLRALFIIKNQMGIERFSNPLLVFVLSLIILIAVSIVLALILKRIFKGNSRYISGY